MLRAYDYAEPAGERGALQDSQLFQREKQIAQNFVITHPLKTETEVCPVCGSRNTRFIFQRWDVNYRFCDDCDSIFVPIDPETCAEYLELPEMKELRCSDAYQSQAVQRRRGIWADFVMWAEYRTYRYLGRNTRLDLIDFGNKYTGYMELFQESKLCGRYELRNSLFPLESPHIEQADVVLYLNQLQHECMPAESLKQIRRALKDDGILILNTRLGSGFDILTLKGGTDNIFPYEHIMLPSKRGLEIILDQAGFDLLEITTPGTRDMEAVLKNRERIEDTNFFVKYLLDNADGAVMADFQQFLQKSGLSSFAQVVAKKR